MWLFTRLGFYSAVEHRERPDCVLVRCRWRVDAKRLVGALPEGYRVQETPQADYRYRVVVRKVDWTAFVAKVASTVDYDNFKNAVHEGTERDGAYAGVWSALYKRGNQERPRAQPEVFDSLPWDQGLGLDSPTPEHRRCFVCGNPLDEGCVNYAVPNALAEQLGANGVDLCHDPNCYDAFEAQCMKYEGV